MLFLQKIHKHFSKVYLLEMQRDLRKLNRNQIYDSFMTNKNPANNCGKVPLNLLLNFSDLSKFVKFVKIVFDTYLNFIKLYKHF